MEWPAGDGNARGLTHRDAARENLLNHLHAQLAQRHADNGERQQRARAHGIDVGQCVGGGDAPEVMRVIHDWHEEIRGGDNRLLVVQFVHRGIVAGFGADEQRRVRQATREFGENFRERRRCDLATAAATVRQAGQPDRFIANRCVHGLPPWYENGGRVWESNPPRTG